MALLNRVGQETGTWRELFGVEFPNPTPKGAVIKKRPVPRTFIVASGVLIAFVLAALVIPRPAEVVPPREPFAEYPMNQADWVGHSQSMEGVYVDQLKLDDYVLADYVNGAGQGLNLYISWYNSQRKGEAVHSPRACLPGGGWQLRDFDQRTLDVKIDGRPLRVNRTLIELGDQRELVYYWFQQRGRIITNEFTVKWYIFWDALTKHRTDGAMVRLIIAVPRTSREADADRQLTQFARQIAPTLNRYVPN
jgi:EpsI family protein